MEMTRQEAMIAARKRARTLDGALKVRDHEPLGAWRFSVEEEGGLMYGSVVFVWPEGDARERYYGSVAYALAFWDRLMGREASEAEKRKYGVAP